MTYFDASHKDNKDNEAQATIYEYYTKVVPTTYRNLKGREWHVYQYTVNSNKITSTHMPSLYLRYDLSPVTVKYEDR